MAFEEEKLNLFKSIAEGQGFSEAEISPLLEFGRIKLREEAEEDIFDPKTDIPFQRTIALREQEEDEEKPKSPEAARLEGIITSGIRGLNAIEEILDPEIEQEGLEGRGELAKTLVPFGLGARALRNEITNVTDVIGRLRSGAAINKEEGERFRSLLPDIRDDDATIVRKLNNLKAELSAVATAAGIEIPESPRGEIRADQERAGVLPETPTPLIQKAKIPPIDIGERAKTLFPILRVFEPIETINKIADLFPRAKKLFQIRKQELKDDPEMFKSQAVQTLFPAAQLLTPEGRAAGLELGVIIFGPELFKRGVKVVGKILRPFKTVGDLRAAKVAQAQGKTISGDVIIKKLEDAGRVISPADEVTYNRFLERARQRFAGVAMSVDDAVRLNTEANKAFTAAGRVGKSAKAAFNRVMGDSIKAQLKIAAPEVIRANKLFGILFKAQKITKRFAPAVIAGELVRRGLRERL
ncbi:MAG TPA: hypothetical protein ENI23_09010, partial [bacterium]|nr:hypothetical protein [bacterium]